MPAGPAEAPRALWESLVRAQALSLPVVHRALRRRNGLSLSEFCVLQALAVSARGSATMTDLQEAAYLSAPGVTRVVGALEERGLISRGRRPADRRLLHAQVTPAGRALFDEATQTVDEVLVQLFGEDGPRGELVVATRVLRELGDAVAATQRKHATTPPTARVTNS
jgi:DNA-binding MarR family transcriptional regulator